MKNKSSKKSKIISVICIVFFLMLLVIGIFLFYDLKRYNNKEKPYFVVMEKTHEYNDGYTKEYYCLGYKVIEYNREKKQDWDIVWWYERVEE